MIKSNFPNSVLGFIASLVILLISTSTLYAQGYKGERLNLSQEQKDIISNLRSEHQKKMVDLNADLKKLQIDKKELLNSTNYNRENRIKIEEKILEQQKKIRLAFVNHQMDIYEQLNDEQKAQWKEGRENIRDRIDVRKEKRMKLMEKRIR